MTRNQFLWRAVMAQTKFQLKRGGAVFAFYALLALVLMNFLGNVIAWQGSDVIHMIQPMKLLLLSYNMDYFRADLLLVLIQWYPLLVSVPAGLSLARERQTGEDVLMAARLGNLHYRLSKLLSAFFTAMIVFSVPLLIEIALNCLAFPLDAQGDLSNLGIYDPQYTNMVRNYLFSDLFLRSPYLYAIVGTLLFGMISGLLSMLTAAVSSVVKVKFRVLLLLPVFLFLNISVYLSGLVENGSSIKWYDYILLFNDAPKSLAFYAVAMAIALAGVLVGAIWGGNRDCIP